MKAPISWLKEFVDIDIPITQLAHQMTMAGLEVESIRFVGLPIPEQGSRDAALSGFTWDPEKLVVASILEVMPHPNADRLTLLDLYEQVVYRRRIRFQAANGRKSGVEIVPLSRHHLPGALPVPVVIQGGHTY